MDGIVAILIMFILFGLPVVAMSATFVITVLSGRWFALKREELALRRWEAEARLEQARLTSGMPAWVDKQDPMEIAAWNKAVVEVYRLSARHAMQVHTD